MEIKDALDMWGQYQSYWSDIYEAARSDQEFALGAPYQWDQKDITLRNGRPCLTVNVLPQFTHQVTNQIRQNTPSINVIPSDAKSSEETAKVLKGLIKRIEYRSDADSVYDTSAENSVTCSLGWIMVDHEYVSTDSFEQELLIKRMPNSLNAWIDPSSIESDGSDAKGAILLEEFTKAQFEREFPGKQFISFEKEPRYDSKLEVINVAHIFKIEYTTIKKQMGVDGSVSDFIEDGDTKKKTRVLKQTVVKRYKFSGADMLAETTFPGIYIPLVPVYGQEMWVDGKRYLISLIRNAKDPQRRYNHWASVESEILAKSPYAPVMAEAGTIEDFAEDWQNPSKSMVLRYKNTNIDGTPSSPPQRLNPPPVPVGIINAMQGAYEDIKRSMGLYDASLGQKSNETSGIAINARKEQGNVATFHFADNLGRSVAQVGRILVSAIPTIYDTARVIQILDEEENPKFVGVNGADPQQGQKEMFDLTTGNYDVRVITGPGFVSKQQETGVILGELISSNPQNMMIFGDIWAKALGQDQLAARLKRAMPPQIVEGDGGSENAPTPKEMQMEQALQAMQQQMQQMQQEAGQKIQELTQQAQDTTQSAQAAMQKNQIDQQKLQLDSRKLDLEGQKIQIDAFKAKSDALIAMNPTPAPDETSEVETLSADASDEVLLGHMEKRKSMKQMEAEKNAAKEAMQQAREEEERQFKIMAMQQNAEQAAAIVNIVSLAAQNIAELTQAVRNPTPIKVVRDPATNLIEGAAPSSMVN